MNPPTLSLSVVGRQRKRRRGGPDLKQDSRDNGRSNDVGGGLRDTATTTNTSNNNNNNNNSNKKRNKKKPSDSTEGEEEESIVAGSSSPSRSSTLGICQDVARYEKIGRVGEGTYGVVYQARDRRRSQHVVVALKRCIPHHESSDGFPVTTLREIQALKICCRHPNIVTLIDIAVKSENDESGRGGVFLVFEYCSQDLADILDRHYHNINRTMEKQKHQRDRHSNSNKSSKRFSSSSSSPFSQSHVKTLAQQLLSALHHCHAHYLIHRDVKPSNLLYDGTTGQLKLADFGLSRSCRGGTDINDNETTSPQILTPNVVSLWYRAPEILLKNATIRDDDGKPGGRRRGSFLPYSFPIDLWAVGCVVAELLQGYPLLDGTSDLDQLSKMEHCLGRPPSRLYEKVGGDTADRRRHQYDGDTSLALWDKFDYLSTDGLSLLTRLLEYDPRERWTAAEALESKYFCEAPLPAHAADMPNFPNSKE